MKKYEIVADEDNGYWMLLEDGIGMAKSKSRNVCLRIRDTLEAVYNDGLVGLIVEEDVGEKPRGTVLALSGNDLIVRLPGYKLDSWCVRDCRIIEPEKIERATPWNDPSIGIYPAVELLKRFLACGVENDGTGLAQVADDTKQFLKAREDAQPT